MTIEFSLREHKHYADYSPNFTFSKSTATIVRTTTTNASLGSGYFFVVIPRTWLHGRYIRWRWQGYGSLSRSTFNVYIYDGAYDRTSAVDFPLGAAIALKGNGLLQTLDTNTGTFAMETVDVQANVAGGSEDYCTLMFRLSDAWSAHNFWLQLDWVEINDGAGGSGPRYNEQFTDAVNREVTGTLGDYGYISTGVVSEDIDEELAAGFTVRHPASSDLTAFFHARAAFEELPAGFTVRQWRENLPGAFVVRQDTPQDLLGGFAVRRSGSPQDLGALFDVTQISQDDLYAKFKLSTLQFSLREHKNYATFTPVFTFSKSDASVLRMYTTNPSLGDGYFFVVVDRTWVNGKYVRWRWRSDLPSTLTAYVRIYDGAYDRSSDVDFPSNSAILSKGNGLLQDLATRDGPFAWQTIEGQASLGGGSEDNCTIFVILHDNQGGFSSYLDLDWLEINSGAGGVGLFYREPFNGPVVMERTATVGDYGYISDGQLPLGGHEALSAGFTVQHPGSQDLAAEFVVGGGTEDLAAELIVRQVGIQDLPAEFVVGAVIDDSEDLPAELVVRQLDSEDLLAELVVRQAGSQGLAAGFEVAQGSDDLAAGFRILNYPRTIGPVTVTTASGSYPIHRPWLRGQFYAHGRHFIVYGDGTGFVYRHSADEGVTWSAPVTLRATIGSIFHDTEGRLSIHFDGVYLHYLNGWNTSNQPLRYRRGRIEPNGGITWSAAEQVVLAANPNYLHRWLQVTADSEGYPVVGYCLYGETEAYVSKSSTNDGTWVTEAGYPLQLSPPGLEWRVEVVSLGSKRLCVAWGTYVPGPNANLLYTKIFDGTNWLADEGPIAQGGNGRFMIAPGANSSVLLSYDRGNDMRFRRRPWGGPWGAEVKILDDTQGIWNVVAQGPDDDTIYIFQFPERGLYPDLVVYAVSTDGGVTWTGKAGAPLPYVWIDETVDEAWSYFTHTSSYRVWDGVISYAYITGTSPYNVRYAALRFWEREDLKAGFEVGQGSVALGASFEVGQGSRNLPAEFIAQHADSRDLPAEFISRQAGSQELLGEFIVQHSDLEDLLGEFVVRRSNFQNVAAGFIVRHPGDQDRYSDGARSPRGIRGPTLHSPEPRGGARCQALGLCGLSLTAAVSREVRHQEGWQSGPRRGTRRPSPGFRGSSQRVRGPSTNLRGPGGGIHRQAGCQPRPAGKVHLEAGG